MVLTALAFSLIAAWGDRIDEGLLDHMPEVIEKCQAKGYKNIGVLTFLLQQGDEASRFRGAAICSNMPQRVENALALKLKGTSPELMLIPRAADVAAKRLNKASYRTAADRERLLDLQFVPAWGDAKNVKPDAFIVGKVKSSKDRRKVTVSLGAFDRNSMFDIVEFDVPTDRFMLADLGQGFSLTKGRVRGVSDDAIFDSVESDIEKTEGSTSDASIAGFPVELTVYYGNDAQVTKIDDESEGSNNLALPEPQPGQNLTFGMKNTSDKPIGVVLLVNGVSTLYEQEGEPEELNKWVLEPNKEYRVKGYHQKDNEKYLEITTLTEEESVEKYEDLGGQQFAGLIHLYVFKTIDADEAESPKFTRSIGRLSRPVRTSKRYESLRELQQAIARRSDLFPPGTRPLAGWGKEMTETLQEKKLGETTLTDTLIVRYSKTKPE